MPTHTPLVHWRCQRCEGRQPFRSSDRFRVNAQKKRLDVWLVYRCVTCGLSHNLPVLERVSRSEIDPERYQAFLRNDRDTAWRCAFDDELFRREGADVEANVDFAVEGEEPTGDAGEVAVEVEAPFPLGVRLDRVLARKLGISRSRVLELAKAGAIRVGAEGAPGAEGGRSVKRKLRQPLRLTLDLGALTRA